MCDRITQELKTIYTFDPFMGPHNKKCDKAREKWKNACLQDSELASSEEIPEQKALLLQ